METFKQHLDKFININDEEFTSVLSFFQVLEVKKKQDLMSNGEICNSLFFCC